MGAGNAPLKDMENIGVVVWVKKATLTAKAYIMVFTIPNVRANSVLRFNVYAATAGLDALETENLIIGVVAMRGDSILIASLTRLERCNSLWIKCFMMNCEICL